MLEHLSRPASNKREFNRDVFEYFGQGQMISEVENNEHSNLELCVLESVCEYLPGYGRAMFVYVMSLDTQISPSGQIGHMTTFCAICTWLS